MLATIGTIFVTVGAFLMMAVVLGLALIQQLISLGVQIVHLVTPYVMMAYNWALTNLPA
jgi:hypothetical protein